MSNLPCTYLCYIADIDVDNDIAIKLGTIKDFMIMCNISPEKKDFDDILNELCTKYYTYLLCIGTILTWINSVFI